MSCLVREPLAASRTNRNRGALFIIDAELGAGVLPEVELGKIAVKVLGIDVLIDADETTLEDRKEALKRVGVHVIAHPFELGMIDELMARDRREFVVRRAIGHETASLRAVTGLSLRDRRPEIELPPKLCHGRAPLAGRVVVEVDTEVKLSREELFEQAHERWKQRAAEVNDMILQVVKAQIIVERFMIALLEAHGRNPKHFFFTAPKIKECKKIDPPEVGQTMWELLSLCSYVRNELVHSLDDEKIKETMDAVRTAYVAATDDEARKQTIREMTDTRMVTDALYHCGSYIVIATDAKVAADKKQKG